MDSQKEVVVFFFYHLCKSLPNTQLFYSLYALAKYIGIIIITHNVKGLEDNVMTLRNLFLSLTFFGKGYSPYYDSYFALITSVFIILLAFSFFVIIAFLYFKSLFKTENSSLSISSWQSINVKIIAIGWTIISFISQHLIELLTLQILNVTYSKEDILKDKYQGTKYIAFLFSIISIVLCEVYSFCFYYFTKSFSLVSTVGDRNLIINIFSHVLMMLCTSSQGIMTVSIHISNGETIHYFLNLSFIFLLLIQCAFSLKEYNHFDTNYSLFFEKFLLYWSFHASLDELVIYHTCHTPFSQSYSLCKIVIEIVNSLVLAQLSISYIKKVYLQRFMTKIFNDKAKFDHNELLAYESLMYQFKQKRLPFNALFQVFTYHKETCSTKTCICKSISITKWINQLQGSVNKKVIEGEIKESHIGEVSFEDFTIIGEHEITKTLSTLHKQRDHTHLEEILINFHIEYILHIKNDLRGALYYSTQYLKLYSHRLSFLYLLYLFEYKYESYFKLTSKKLKGEQKQLGEQTLYRKHLIGELFIHPTKLFQFTFEIQNIRKLLIKCSDYLSKINEFRRSIESKTSTYNTSMMKSETFISFCREYKKNHLELCQLILNSKQYNNNKKFKHYETCYLLSMYFESSMHSIPKKKFHKVFKIIPSYDFFIEKNIKLNSYKNFNVMNPLILFINKTDDFIIKYISISLCNKLNYIYHDIIDTPFDQLIPNETLLLHKLLLKKFILTSNNSFKTTKFILDNKKNLLPIRLTAKPFPTIEFNFGITISIQFNSKPKLLEKDYYLLLDKDWNILSTNKEFSDEFFFTLQMLSMLKMNYSSFFGINMEKMKLKAKGIFFKSAKSGYASLEEENHVLIPFSSGKQETMFRDRKMSDIDETIQRVKKCVIHGNISQISMLKNLENINLKIDEMGFDIEWYTRVNCLKDRIVIAGNLFSLQVTYTLVNIEKLIYIVAHLIESVNPLQSDAIEMIKESIHKLDFFNISNTDTKDHLKNSITKYDLEVKKYKQYTKDNLSIKNNDLECFSPKNKSPLASNVNLGNVTNHTNNPGLSSSSTFKKDPLSSVSGLPSQHSLLGINRTNVALLNISMQKRSIFERSEIHLPETNYENRKLNSYQQLKDSMVWISKVFCLCFLVLGLFSFVFNTSIMELSINLFNINIYAILLKSDIYFSSLNILASCEMAESGETLGLIEQRLKLSSKAEEIMSHFTLFSRSLNNLVGQPQVKEIFNVINTNEVYKSMQKNYEIKIKLSGIYDEILFFHYSLMQLSDSNSFQTCRFELLFINKVYEQMINSTPPPSYEETIVHYVCANVLSSLRSKLEDLVRTTNAVLKDYFAYCQLSITLYNLSTITMIILMSISFSIIVIHSKNNIQILLNIIYTQQPSEEKYENQLKAYRVILDSFSSENCIKYEKAVKMQVVPLNTTKTEKSTKERKPHRLNQLKDSKHDNQSNAKAKVKSFPKRLTTPRLIQFSLLIIIILLACLAIIIIFDTLFSRSIYDDFMLANIIAINFIDQLPKFSELYLYEGLSIMFNDIFYLTTSPNDYDSHSYSNYYNITIDTETNTVFQILKDSEYAFLHYQLNRIKLNLNRFLYTNRKSKVLNRMIDWEHKLNSKEGLCLYNGVGINLNTMAPQSLLSLMKTISDEARKCREIGKGMGINSLNDFLEFANKELTSLYIDFASLDKDERDPRVFMNLFVFESIARIIEETLKKVHNANLFYIFKDLNDMFDYGNNLSFTFSLILVIIAFLVLIFIHFFLFSRIEENISILTFIQKILLGKTI